MNKVVILALSIILCIIIIAATSIGIQNHNECETWTTDTAEKLVKRDSRKTYLIIMLVIAILVMFVDTWGIYDHVKGGNKNPTPGNRLRALAQFSKNQK